MQLDNLLIVLSLILIFVVACTTMKPKNTADSCILFNEKKNWYKATKKSYDKWNTPISLQLAIINQESSFQTICKTKKKKIIWYNSW